MVMHARRLTTYDLEMFYKGLSGHPFTVFGDLLDIMKADMPWDTSVGLPAYNQVYGALVWAQINQESVAFGMLPKTTWLRSGWRVKTGLSTTPDAIGIGETANLPDSVRLQIQVVKASPKIQTLVFDVSDVVEALATLSMDDVFGTMHQVRAEFGVEFAKLINRQLLAKNTTSDPTAGNRFESIDRIVGMAGEPGAGNVNVYGIDRSTNSWANSYVSHNNGTLRELSDDLIREALAGVRAKGGNTNVMLTGYDTYAKIQGLYTVLLRFVPYKEMMVQLGVNGVETVHGMDVGMRVASVYGIPLLQSVDCPRDGDGIQRLYLLDLTDTEGYGIPRFGISILRPVEYFETREYLLLDKYVIRGAYRIVGENICRALAYQGKIMDLM